MVPVPTPGQHMGSLSSPAPALQHPALPDAGKNKAGHHPAQRQVPGNLGSRKGRRKNSQGSDGRRTRHSVLGGQDDQGIRPGAWPWRFRSVETFAEATSACNEAVAEDLWGWEAALESVAASSVDMWLAVLSPKTSAEEEGAEREGATLGDRAALDARDAKASLGSQVGRRQVARAGFGLHLQPAVPCRPGTKDGEGQSGGGVAPTDSPLLAFPPTKSLVPSAAASTPGIGTAAFPILTYEESAPEAIPAAAPCVSFPDRGQLLAPTSTFDPTRWLLGVVALLVAPWALLSLGLTLLPSLVFPAVALWLLAECVFIPLRLGQLLKASRSRPSHPALSPEEQGALFGRILELLGPVGVSPEDFVSRWFRGAQVSTLDRRTVAEWLACSLAHCAYDDLSPQHRDALDLNVARLEKALGAEFKESPATPREVEKEGPLPRLKTFLQGGQKELPPPYMAHTFEPLSAVVHPFALYAWGHLVGGFTSLVLRTMGFTRHTSRITGFSYFVLKGTPKAPGEAPEQDACVFLHGLGLGLTPYLSFLALLAKRAPHHTLVALELPHLAFQLCSTIPSVETLVESVEEALDEAVGKDGKAVLVGHSYGSFVASNFVKCKPHRVSGLGLVDPVSILLCLPDVVYNFIYKQPDNLEDFIRWVTVSLELNVAQALCRVFNWHTLTLWAHDMPSNTLVLLSEDDTIVPSPQVRQYLEKHGVPYIYQESQKHGEFLVRIGVQEEFLRRLFHGGV